jgi:ribosome-binding factor A
MGAPKRITRVNEILKREIADIIEREKPGCADAMLVSVTGVVTTPDLRKATVKISVFGGDDAAKHKVIRALHGMRQDIQKTMSRHVILKYTPVLSFVLDRNLESGDRVLSILEDLDDGE